MRSAIRALALVAAAPAVAETHAPRVTLASPAGDMVIEGDLLGFDGATYDLDTIYGPLTLDAAALRCTGGACPEAGTPRLVISGAALAGRVLVPALIAGHARAAGLDLERLGIEADRERFVLARGGTEVLRVDLRLSTTSEGIADLVAREADVALALRPVRPDERAVAADAGLGRIDDPRRMRVLAAGALVPVVAPGNPLRALGLSDLVRALSGEARDWSELGVAELGPIRLHLPEAHLGDAEGVEDLILAPVGGSVPGDARRHPGEASLAAAVAADPGALGVVRAGQAGAARVLAMRGTCGAVLAATPMAVARGDHPFASPVWMLLPARPLPGPARDLLAWMAGPEAQPIVRRAGFPSRGEVPLGAQGGRIAQAVAAAGDEVSLADLQAMLGRLAGRARLSTTFRFSGGGAALDAASRDAALDLGGRIARGEMAGRRLLLAGFTDGVGGPVANARLSRRRAEAARRAVLQAARDAGTAEPARSVPVAQAGEEVVFDAPGGPVELRVAGFGEASPLACDDDAWGRAVNRRVEVWATP